MAHDPCAPIGKTADGKLVYSLKCDALPAPAPTATTAAPPVATDTDVERHGLFGLGFTRKPGQ